MASCRNCIHWIICSKTDGTTHYYGKENAAGNVETLCTDFRNTADFVPKSEIERLKKRGRCGHIICPEAKTALAIKIFEDIGKFNRAPFGYICASRSEIEELKKKYVEGVW